MYGRILMMIREKCYAFARWAYEQNFESVEELNESFRDDFHDCVADYLREIEEIFEGDEQEEDYDED